MIYNTDIQIEKKNSLCVMETRLIRLKRKYIVNEASMRIFMQQIVDIYHLTNDS